LRWVFFILGLLVLGAFSHSVVLAAEGQQDPQKPGGWWYEYGKAIDRKDCAQVRFHLGRGQALGDKDAFFWDGLKHELVICELWPKVVF
jgi:hypothetical protein